MKGSELKRQRLALNLTQLQLSVQFGVAKDTVARWEREELKAPRWLDWAFLGLEIALGPTDPAQRERQRARHRRAQQEELAAALTKGRAAR